MHLHPRGNTIASWSCRFELITENKSPGGPRSIAILPSTWTCQSLRGAIPLSIDPGWALLCSRISVHETEASPWSYKFIVERGLADGKKGVLAQTRNLLRTAQRSGSLWHKLWPCCRPSNPPTVQLSGFCCFLFNLSLMCQQRDARSVTWHRDPACHLGVLCVPSGAPSMWRVFFSVCVCVSWTFIKLPVTHDAVLIE